MTSTPQPATGRLAPLRLITGILAVLALLSLLADGLIHRHGHFSAEETFGFYPLCGLLSSSLTVIAARCLRPILQRPPTYYDGSPSN
jgi:hypothetical protein